MWILSETKGAYHLYRKNVFWGVVKCQMERFKPVKIFPEYKECLRRYSSFFVSTKVVPFAKISPMPFSHPRSTTVNLGTSHPRILSSTGSFLTNGTALYFDPFLPERINCSICPKNPTQMDLWRWLAREDWKRVSDRWSELFWAVGAWV